MVARNLPKSYRGIELCRVMRGYARFRDVLGSGRVLIENPWPSGRFEEPVSISNGLGIFGFAGELNMGLRPTIKR